MATFTRSLAFTRTQRDPSRHKNPQHFPYERQAFKSELVFDTQNTKKLGDVGESKYADPAKLTKCDKIVGTPLYLSPEIIKAQPYDQRVDLWAIGCVLYELLSLATPFKENDLMTLCHSILNKTPAPVPA